jgi:hypothetical protein
MAKLRAFSTQVMSPADAVLCSGMYMLLEKWLKDYNDADKRSI